MLRILLTREVMKQRLAALLVPLGLTSCACETTSPTDAGRASADTLAVDAAAAPQPCASRMETIPILPLSPDVGHIDLEVVSVGGTVWIAALETFGAEDRARLAIAHWSRSGGAVNDRDESLSARAGLAGARRWPEGFSIFYFVGGGELRRARFRGETLRSDALREASGRPLFSNDGGDFLLQVRDTPGGVVGELARWGDDGSLASEARAEWRLTRSSTLAWSVAEGGFYAVGFMASNRGPWRGLVGRFEPEVGFVEVVPDLLLTDESPRFFGPLAGGAGLLLADGTVLDLARGGDLLTRPSLGATGVQNARFGEQLLAVGGTESGPFVDPSERHFDNPLYHWQVDADGLAAGGARPIHTGSCSSAAVDRLPGGGVAIAHTCFGEVSLTLLCAEGV
ncbi:MAG: hypothetical protein OHK0013_45780 [Sandaracinaceae bacterium]